MLACLLVFETGFLCVALAAQELPHSVDPSASPGIKLVPHQAWFNPGLLNVRYVFYSDLHSSPLFFLTSIISVCEIGSPSVECLWASAGSFRGSSCWARCWLRSSCPQAAQKQLMPPPPPAWPRHDIHIPPPRLGGRGVVGGGGGGIVGGCSARMYFCVDILTTLD